MAIDKFEFISYCDRGLKRENNEDSILVNDDAKIFAVADGLGGHSAGEIASNEVISILKPWLLERDEDPYEGLKKVIQSANSHIIQLAEGNPQYDGMGTTVNVLMRYLDKVIIANIGDSRCYLFKKGKLRQVTTDHTLAEELRSAGKVPEEFSPEHSSNHILTRALGTKKDVEIDFQEIALESGDIYFLCTDGVNKHMEDKELEETFNRHYLHLRRIREEIIDTVFGRGATDNLSFIIIRF